MKKKMWDQIIENLRQMMLDRGYKTWTRSRITEDDTIFISTSMELQHSCLVFLCKTEKFNIESVKYLIFQLQQHKLKHGIMIYQTIVTSSAKKAIDHLLDYTIEMFETKEVLYNPTHHRFYCPHIRLSKDTVTEELPRMNLQSLPSLLRTDVISRYFRFQKGDVIRIHRKNGAIAYRLVK